MTQTTVKLSAVKAIVVKNATGGTVPVDLTSFGIAAVSEALTPDQAYILGDALMREAGEAQNQKIGRAA